MVVNKKMSEEDEQLLLALRAASEELRRLPFRELMVAMHGMQEGDRPK